MEAGKKHPLRERARKRTGCCAVCMRTPVGWIMVGFIVLVLFAPLLRVVRR